MKNISEILKTAVLTAVIVWLTTACVLLKDDDDTDADGPTLYSGTLKIINQQVWEGTDSNKLSEVYKKFEEDRDINVNVNVYWPDGNGNFNPTKKLGSGEIKKGILRCEVPEPEADDLMAWDNFKYLFSAWGNIDCAPQAKGTYLRLVTAENKWLNRETMSGSSDSVWLESIWYIYVDMDCRITGTPSEGLRPGDAFYKTPEKLDLALKKGWNTLCRKQLLRADIGIEVDLMKIKNPHDFKWVIRPAP